MPTGTARGSARSALARLVRADLDNDAFQLEAAAVLRQAIGFDWWCWTLLDPGTRLPTRYLTAERDPGAQAMRRFFRLTWDDREASPTAGRPRARSAVTALSAATGGDLRRDECWRELLGPAGTGDSLTIRMVADGACWARLNAGRDSSSRWFSEDETAFLAELAPLLAGRLRDGLRTGVLDDPPGDAPGTIILDRDCNLVAATGQAWRWIARLGLQRPNAAEPLPGFIYAIAARIAATPGRPAAGVRLQTADGHWAVVHGAAITDGPSAADGYAITFERARPDDLAPLLMRAWSLTPREREVARLALDGLSGDDIAARLFISAHTARDHLKAIFGKLGVHRRRDLAIALAGPAQRDAS
jgi:DNA-binding CsgD family transcriptional regulator